MGRLGVAHGPSSRHSGRAFWLLYAVLALSACYTHTLALLTVAAQLLFAVVFLSAASWMHYTAGRSFGEALRPWAWPTAAALVIAAGFTPWVGAFREKSEEAVRTYWIGAALPFPPSCKNFSAR